MLSFSAWGLSNDPLFQKKRVWAFDLDDTLTERGVLSSEVFKRLEWLQSQGHFVVLVTGRPAPWAQVFVKVFPFDAAIAENGAVLFFWSKGKIARKEFEEPIAKFWSPGGYLTSQEYSLSTDSKKQSALKELVLTEVTRLVPEVLVASDQKFRLYDLAIDFAEAVDPPLGLDVAQKIKRIFESHGAVAKISSIHVNGWWGSFDKCLGLKSLFDEVHWSCELSDVVYFGDSPNDAPLFDFAPISVGVANLKNFEADLSWHRPKFITNASSGAGVCQAIDHYFNQGSPK